VHAQRAGEVITIDGPSGVGKTTVARLIAHILRFTYLDTGALYRAVALALRNRGIDPDDSDERIRSVLDNVTVTFENGKILMDGIDVSGQIRSKEMDHYSSVYSARKVVRDFLLSAQRDAAFRDNLVVEGRDTGTIVFPEAGRKIFLDASVEERAKRRYEQYREKGIDISMEEARKGIIERDSRDANRDIAPLKASAGALIVDSSHLDVEQVVRKILGFVKDAGSE
jgi:cytidylate kinase